jgi:Fur family ferric uptake transcriptional regulator
MSSTFQLEKVEVALSPQERFQEFLQSRGRRMTQQRRQIVDEVFSRHEHFNADELCDHLSRSAGTARVSRPTVYRTLTELEEAGLLRKMVLTGRRGVYEHDYGYPQHDHLYCEKCEKLIEFHSEEVARIRDAVAREHNFRASSHRLIINGLCDECFRAKRRPRRLELV